MTLKYCKQLVLLLAVFLTVSMQVLATEKRTHIVFISPWMADNPFGQQVETLMQAAADDFDMRLTVVNVKPGQVYSQQRINDIFDLKPDFLLFSYQRYSHFLLQQAETQGVKSLIVFSPIPQQDRELVDYPTGMFSHWIGHIAVDEYRAGYHLTRVITEHARAGLTESTGDFELLAFNGQQGTVSADERQRGLVNAAMDYGVKIKASYSASWVPLIATSPLVLSVRQHPDAKLFWAASDDIALAINNNLKLQGKKPNRDYYTAGIDWTPAGLNSVARGELTASIGGHFMIGAWALVMIQDYLHGHHSSGLEITVPMAIADQNNIHKVQHMLDHYDWQGVDFNNYTLIRQLEAREYDFSLERIFEVPEMGEYFELSNP